MSKARVCLIVPSLRLGGAERVMAQVANGFAREGADVLVLVIGGESGTVITLSGNIRIRFLRQKRVRYSIISILGVLKDERPDVVLSTLGYLNIVVGLIRPLFPKIRFVAREANIPSVQLAGGGVKSHFTLWLYRRVYSQFDRIICQSTDMRVDLAENIGISDKKLVVIHNPINVDEVRVLAEKKGMSEVSLGPKRPIILAVGNMKRQKQFHLLAQVLQKVTSSPSVEMHLVGDGSERLFIESEFSRLGLSDRVFFWGMQGNPYPFMRASDCFVLTSAYEGFPNVVLEAGACGLPVVAFTCPGVSREIIQDGLNGYLVPQADISGMAKRIDDVLAADFNKKSVEGFVRTRFDAAKIIKEYWDVCFV